VYIGLTYFFNGHLRSIPDTLADKEHSLSRAETGPVIAVSLISALRLLGIFLMLPIFSVYAVRYAGASMALAGVAFGIYALMQSLAQIPLGWASDRWGRKPVLLFGLALFALGSIAWASPRLFFSSSSAASSRALAPWARSHLPRWPT
jgi:MFS family permease